MNKERAVALVTGASCGIGAAYALKLAQQGYSLVLVARSEDRLKVLAQTLERSYGVTVLVCRVDLTSPRAVDSITAFTKMHNLDIDLLINNAGFGDVGVFCDHALSEHKAMLDAMLYAVVGLTHVYLPGMLARNSGGIVNVSSVVGLLGPTLKSNIRRALYRPIKSFMIAFTEQLSIGYRESSVVFQCLCPGLTISNFHKRSNQMHLYREIPALFWQRADTVVDISIRALNKPRKVVVIPGILNRIFVQLSAVIGLFL